RVLLMQAVLCQALPRTEVPQMPFMEIIMVLTHKRDLITHQCLMPEEGSLSLVSMGIPRQLLLALPGLHSITNHSTITITITDVPTSTVDIITVMAGMEAVVTTTGGTTRIPRITLMPITPTT